MVTIYILERKDKNGFIERIQAYSRCKGWRVVGMRKVDLTPDGHLVY